MGMGAGIRPCRLSPEACGCLRCAALLLAVGWLLWPVGSAALGAEPAPPPLAACWRFDEPGGAYAIDSSGNGLDAALVGATRASGVGGGAVVLDGQGQALVADGVGPLPEGGAEAWVRLEAPPETGQAGFLCFGSDLEGRNDAAILGYCGSLAPGKVVMGFCPLTWVGAAAEAKLPVGEWVHLAAAWDKEAVALYIAGEKVATDTTHRLGLGPHQKVLMGAGSWGGYLRCALDEVRIYAGRPADELFLSHATDVSYATDPVVTGPSEADPRPVVDAAEYFSERSPTCGLQEAVDALPRRGGLVVIPPGSYLLQRSVVLRNRVTMRGSGAATVLRKAPEVCRPLAADAAEGATEVRVQDPAGFCVGTEVAIMDDRMRGWYVTHAIVEGIEGASLRLSRPLSRECLVSRGAVAINLFPALSATGLEGITIEGLTIDGNLPRRPTESCGDFTCAAVHLHSCTRPRVENVTVLGWPSDGIGVQGGSGAIVRGCSVDNCVGHGYHPGTGLRGGAFTANTGRGNRWDGLYFCADVRYTQVSGCVFSDNGHSGIGGLGNGGDRWNVCSGNTCSGNGYAGIQMNSGRDNTVTGNVCVGNSRSAPGEWAGITLQDCTDCLVQANRCGDDGETPTQWVGVSERGASEANLISGNHLGGSRTAVETVGPDTRTVDNYP